MNEDSFNYDEMKESCELVWRIMDGEEVSFSSLSEKNSSKPKPPGF